MVGEPFREATRALNRALDRLRPSDQFNVDGVIAYVLVTGRPPFWGRENKEIIRKIVRGNVRFPCKDFIDFIDGFRGDGFRGDCLW